MKMPIDQNIILPNTPNSHMRCGARILRFVSLSQAGINECKRITEFAYCLIRGKQADYEMLLSAQEEMILIGGSTDMFDDIRKDFVH